MKVFINPGHMPNVDPGAVHHNWQEARIAATIGEHLESYLQKSGVETVLLQSDNLYGESPAYPCVVENANSSGADIFVSIHLNASDNPDATGTEVLVYNADSVAGNLAENILCELTETYRHYDPLWANRGIKERPGLAVLRGTDMPAVLIETAFISNDFDCTLTVSHPDTIAAAIARGITNYENEMF